MDLENVSDHYCQSYPCTGILSDITLWIFSFNVSVLGIYAYQFQQRKTFRDIKTFDT